MLHFNKGLAGASAEDVAAARDTAMNPAVLTAFALAIIAGGDAHGLPGPVHTGQPIWRRRASNARKDRQGRR